MSRCTNGPFTNSDDLGEMPQNVAHQCLHCLFILLSNNGLKMSSVYSVCCFFETSLPDASVEANSVICEVWSWTTLFLEKDSVSFIRQQCKLPFVSIDVIYILKLSCGMGFPTMWYVRLAKPQISLRIRAG